MERNKPLIEEYFDIWINNYPESYHWKDMERFYSLVRVVCRHGRKYRDQKWLRDKIEKRNHNLTEEDIKYYCNLFYRLQDFYKFIRSIKKEWIC